MKRAFVVVVLCAISAWAGPKKKGNAKPAQPTTAAASAAVTQVLDGLQPAASACMVELLGNTTAWTATVKVSLVLDGRGRLMEVLVNSTPENAGAANPCIEKVVQGASWPTTHAPLVTAEREWTFAMQ